VPEQSQHTTTNTTLITMKSFTVVSAWVLFAAVGFAQNKGSPDLPKSENMYKCAPDDAECWNAECLYWTNKIRRDAGVAPLSMGSMGMLDNAEGYSRTLDRMKGLKHQNIGSIKLPCGMRVFGENIAYNFAAKNPAWYCMNQWKKSPGHYQNIVRERFASVVTGVYVAKDGRVSCTQIFAPTKPEGGERGCEAAPTKFPRGSTPQPTDKSEEKEPVTETKPSPSPSPMAMEEESKKMKSECRTFTLWGKYVCEMCRGAKYWTCMVK